MKISIEMGPGLPDEIIILHEDDEPYIVATNFAKKFELGPQAAVVLEQ